MNALTVDLEDYYHTNGLNVPIDNWSLFESRESIILIGYLNALRDIMLREHSLSLALLLSDFPHLLRI